MSRPIPIIAILAHNALMGIGLRSILEKIIPFATFKVCDDFEQIAGSEPEDLFHIFVTANIVVEHLDFFSARRSKTILLTTGSSHVQHLAGYPSINIAASQEQIESAVRQLHGRAHTPHTPHHHAPAEAEQEVLSQREVEVLRLVVEGLINKEIADRLHISLSTVISHRKNIVDKLGIRSVAGLTIYAVMKRYVEI